jgi:hypothetical protein
MRLPRLIAALAVAGFVLAPTARADAQTVVAIDADDIGGVVTGPHGPEAGVWVIAETRDLPTRFAKLVVTDDQGRYVVPDLPAAKYQLWVRGYGLVDSPKVDAAPGRHVNLTAVPAPNEAAAAQYYPAIYWFAMLKIPDKDQFGGRERHSGKDDASRLADDDQEPILRRLSPARPARNADDPCGARAIQKRRGSMDPASAGRPSRAAHGQSAGGQARRRPVQIFRRMDGSDRRRRITFRQTATAARRGAQYRRHDLGLERRKEVSARSDFVG